MLNLFLEQRYPAGKRDQVEPDKSEGGKRDALIAALGVVSQNPDMEEIDEMIPDKKKFCTALALE